MKREHESVGKMWQEYLAAAGGDLSNTGIKYTAWHFCDNEEDANHLAQLVLKGVKRATASLYLAYEFENEDLPRAGDYSIITDWDGAAQCIIRITRVEVVPYNEVTREFAAKEGEGDKTLEHWRKVHWHFFSKEMREMGKEPREDMLVVCQEFEVVFP